MKKLLAAVAVLVLAFVLVGYLLPADYRVERERVIAAAPAAIHAQVRDLESWPTWTAWSRAADPECTWTFDGATEAGGPTVMHWSGPRHGDGTVEFTRIDDPLRLDFTLTGVDGDTLIRSAGEISLRPLERDGPVATEVLWSISGEMESNPVHRWVGLFMDGFIGTDLERGLAGLEEAVLERSASD